MWPPPPYPYAPPPPSYPYEPQPPLTYPPYVPYAPPPPYPWVSPGAEPDTTARDPAYYRPASLSPEDTAPSAPPALNEEPDDPSFLAPGSFAPTYSLPPPPDITYKKALLIGCCYKGTSAELRGCINDVKCLKHLLITKFGFQEKDIVMLEDSQSHPDFLPTRYNIMRGIYWLLTDTRPGSSLFFSFSGHGSQVTDYSGDEENGLDETILPCDYRIAGQITDDELNDRLIKPLMPGVTLNCIVDACHSGSVLDLQYHCVVKPGKPFVWKKGRFEHFKSTSGGLALQFSACKDSQVAADTSLMSGTAHTGAATYAFIQAIEAGGVYQTYGQVLRQMHASLLRLGGRSGGGLSSGGGDILGGIISMVAGSGGGGGGGQTPVLSCNQPLSIDTTYLLI